MRRPGETQEQARARASEKVPGLLLAASNSGERSSGGAGGGGGGKGGEKGGGAGVGSNHGDDVPYDPMDPQSLQTETILEVLFSISVLSYPLSLSPLARLDS